VRAQDAPGHGDHTPRSIGERIEVPVAADDEASLTRLRQYGLILSIQWPLEHVQNGHSRDVPDAYDLPTKHNGAADRGLWHGGELPEGERPIGLLMHLGGQHRDAPGLSPNHHTT